MQKQEVINKALNSSNLPTLPTVATQLIKLTAREDTTLNDIANLISQDISLSTKILKVSNSAFYNFPQQISSISQAVSLLGTNAVRSLVLSFSFLSIKGGKKETKFDFKKFWQESLSSAVAAKLILEQVEEASTEEVLISGLLQNLGELIFALTFTEDYEKILERKEDNPQNQLSDEESTFGMNHTDMGYEIAKSWGFPESLCTPILHHHDPKSYEGDNKETYITIAAIHLSDILTHILYSDSPETYHKLFRKRATSLLKLSNDKIENILDNLHTEIEAAASYFDFKMKSSKSVQEILQEANIRLSLMNLDYDQMNKQLIETKVRLEKLTKELKEKNKALENLAYFDGLTKVHNHRYFQSTLDREINRAERKELSLSLVMLDIDFFKKFNDTYGHQTGDFILQELAQLILGKLREYDTLARYGGEEFAIILPETELAEAMIVAEKIRIAIEEHPFEDDRGNTYEVTSSFGVVSGKPAIEDNFNKNDFISKADTALYAAKSNGRNQVAEYKPKKKGWFSR